MGFIPNSDFQNSQEMVGVLPSYSNNWGVTTRSNLGSRIEMQFGYDLGYLTETHNKALKRDTSVLFADSYFDTTNGSRPVSVYYDNREYIKDSAKVAAFSTGTDTMAYYLSDKEISHDWTAKFKVRIFDWLKLDLGGGWKWRDNRLDYKYEPVLSQLDLQDSTLQSLGFLREGDDQWQQDYKVGIQFQNKRFREKIQVKWKQKSRVARSQKDYSWSIRNQFRMDIIPRKLTLGLNAEMGKQRRSEVKERFFYQATEGGEKFYYYSLGDTSATNINSSQTRELTAFEPQSFSSEVQTEPHREWVNETDYKMEVTARWNLSNSMYLEGFVKKEWYFRPDQLEQEYFDTSGQMKLFLNF